MEDLEHLQSKVKRLEEDLASTKLAIGTLVVWLQRELGTKNCEDLLSMLNGDESEGDRDDK